MREKENERGREIRKRRNTEKGENEREVEGTKG